MIIQIITSSKDHIFFKISRYSKYYRSSHDRNMFVIMKRVIGRIPKEGKRDE